MTSATERKRIEGLAIPVRGNDIDTDRIIPARYLKSVVFEGLGEHVFADDRTQLREVGKTHAFDDARFEDASIMLVNQNFGCGSSREHAPQAIMRWGRGIKAILGESFAEIFFGNCLALGIPCLVLSNPDIETLMHLVEQNPKTPIGIDLERRQVSTADRSFKCEIEEGPRQQLIKGTWDSTAALLANKKNIAKVAKALPYFSNFNT